MSKIISAGTVLLVSPNDIVRYQIFYERNTAPLVCLNTLSDSYRYLKRFNDADMIYLDSALLTKDAIHPLETELHHLSPRLKIAYLLLSTNELYRLPLPKNSLFRLLEPIN